MYHGTRGMTRAKERARVIREQEAKRRRQARYRRDHERRCATWEDDLTRACPLCGAQPGQECTGPESGLPTYPHAKRRNHDG